MVLLDAAMTRFGRWWWRVERSGRAYAKLADRHPAEYRRNVRVALFWGAAALAAVLLIVLALATGSGWPALLELPTALLPVAQFVRIARREARLWASFLVLDKLPHAIGIGRYWWSRLSDRRRRLIEYKGLA